MLDIVRSLWGWLWDRSMGPPGLGGHWPPWLTVAFHGSNLTIGLGQLAIPLMVWVAWKYRREGLSPALVWSVLIFLPSMALSRFGRVVEIWGAPYHLLALLDCLTAALTIYSDLRLPRLIWHILKLPSRDEIHVLNNRLNAEVLDKENQRLDAQERCDRALRDLAAAQDIIRNQLWLKDTSLVLMTLDRAAATLRTEARDHGGC